MKYRSLPLFTATRYELANCYCMKLEFNKAAEIYALLVDVPKFQVPSTKGFKATRSEPCAAFNSPPVT